MRFFGEPVKAYKCAGRLRNTGDHCVGCVMFSRDEPKACPSCYGKTTTITIEDVLDRRTKYYDKFSTAAEVLWLPIDAAEAMAYVKREMTEDRKVDE